MLVFDSFAKLGLCCPISWDRVEKMMFFGFIRFLAPRTAALRAGACRGFLRRAIGVQAP